MCMMCNCSSKWRGTILYIFVSICGDGVFVILSFFFPRRCGVDSPPMCPSLLLTINPYTEP